MKIGFVCNTNNYPFALALAMRRQGADAVAIIDSLSPLHRPEFRFPAEDIGYGEWVIDLAPLRLWDAVFPTPRHRTAQRVLRGCDAIVATGVGIGLAAQLGKPLFAIAAGSDLDVMADEEHLRTLTMAAGGTLSERMSGLAKAWFLRRLAPWQQLGFSSAVGVEYTLPGLLPHGDALLDRFGVAPARRHAFMLVDLEKVKRRPLPQNRRLRVLGMARLQWVKPFPPGFTVLDDKANNNLLIGIAQYRQRRRAHLELRLPRKGQHVAQTERLVHELGLQDIVTWLPEMGQKEFSEEVAAADIVVDTLGEGTIGMGAREAMALGRPVIANGKPEIFAGHLGEPLPVAQARSPAEVAAQLEALDQREARQQLADRARAFAERYFSAERAAATILSLFDDELARRR